MKDDLKSQGTHQYEVCTPYVVSYETELFGLKSTLQNEEDSF